MRVVYIIRSVRTPPQLYVVDIFEDSMICIVLFLILIRGGDVLSLMF